MFQTLMSTLLMVLHMLDEKKSQVSVKTFQDYSQLMFLPYIERMLPDIVRIYVVQDVYSEDPGESLKAHTHGTTVDLVILFGSPTTPTFLLSGSTSFGVMQTKIVCSNF